MTRPKLGHREERELVRVNKQVDRRVNEARALAAFYDGVNRRPHLLGVVPSDGAVMAGPEVL